MRAAPHFFLKVGECWPPHCGCEILRHTCNAKTWATVTIMPTTTQRFATSEPRRLYISLCPGEQKEGDKLRATYDGEAWASHAKLKIGPRSVVIQWYKTKTAEERRESGVIGELWFMVGHEKAGVRLLCTAEVAQTEMDQLKPGCQHVTNSPWKMPLRKTAFANHHLHSNDLAKHFALRIWSAWQLSKRRLLQCLNGVGSISISEKNNAEKRKSWQVIILRDAQQQLSARKMFKVNKGRQNKSKHGRARFLMGTCCTHASLKLWLHLEESDGWLQTASILYN